MRAHTHTHTHTHTHMICLSLPPASWEVGRAPGESGMRGLEKLSTGVKESGLLCFSSGLSFLSVIMGSLGAQHLGAEGLPSPLEIRLQTHL